MSKTESAAERMQKRLRKIRFNKLLSAAVSVVFGIVLLIWSGAAVAVTFKVFGVVIAAAGIAAVIAYLVQRGGGITGIASLIGGAALIVAGVWIFRNPQDPTALFSIVTGLIVCVSGVSDIVESLGMAGAGFSRWWFTFLTGLILIGLGILLIVHPNALANLIVKIMGAVLVVNGLTDIAVVHGVSRAAKEAVQDRTAFDTEYREKDAAEAAGPTPQGAAAQSGAPDAAGDGQTAGGQE